MSAIQNIFPSGSLTRRRLAELLLVLAGCLCLTILFPWPWLPNRETIPTTYLGKSSCYARIDARIWTYLLTWGAQHPERFYDAPVLRPLPQPLVANDPRLTEGWWSGPLFRRLPPVLAWGILAWFALFSAAVSAYYAGRFISGSPWGGVALTVFFAFGNFRATHVCHIEGLIAPFLPLLPAALLAYTRRPNTRRAFLLVAVAFLAIIEYSYTAVVLAPALVLALGWGVWRRRLPSRLTAWALLGLALLLVVTLWPTAMLYQEFHTGTRLERYAWENDLNSADLRAWLTGPDGRLLPPWGGEGRDFFDVRLFPGFVVLGLGLAGAARLWRRSPEIVIMGLVSFLLALGTWRFWWWLLGLPPLTLPTPYEILSSVLLPLRAIRSPARLAVLFHLTLAIAAALACTRLAERGRSGKAVALLLLATAFFGEARAGMHAERILPPDQADPAWAWLAAQPGAQAVLEAPMGRYTFQRGFEHEAVALLHALVHGKPTPNGTIATLIPWHESLATHFARPRRGETEHVLRALGVGYVVVPDERSAAPWLALPLRRVFVSPGGIVVMAVDSPASVPVSPAQLQERLHSLALVHARCRDSEASFAASAGVPAALAGRIELINPAVVRAGGHWMIAARVVNEGRDTWCANGALFGLGPKGDIVLKQRGWQKLPPTSDKLARDWHGQPLGGVTTLPCDLAPGESVALVVGGVAPRETGRHRLTVDLASPDWRWFHRLSEAASIEVEVIP